MTDDLQNDPHRLLAIKFIGELREKDAEIDRLRAAVQEMTTRAGAGYDREDSVEWLESIVRIGKAALGSEQQPKMCQHGIDTNRWHCPICAGRIYGQR